MKYLIYINKSVLKNLSRIPLHYQDKIIKAIRSLALNPRPYGANKLKGRDAWRIRIDNYRIIYEIHDDRLVVIVVVISHRKDAYR